MCSYAQVAFLVCYRSNPGLALEQQPLISSLVTSLASTVSRNDRKSVGPFCLYICADDTDDYLTSRSRELRRAVLHTANVFSLRILFYPPPASIQQLASAAYAEGAKFFIHAHGDANFAASKSQPGWISQAVQSLRSSELGYAVAAVQSTGLHAAPTVVARRHLDIFADMYPAQLQEGTLDVWLRQTYSSAQQPERPLAATVAQRREGGRSKPGLLSALIDCGRHVLATHEGNRTAPAACTAHLSSKIHSLRQVIPSSSTSTCRPHEMPFEGLGKTQSESQQLTWWWCATWNAHHGAPVVSPVA